MWDFQLQKSRDCDDTQVLTFDGLEVPKSFQDMPNMNCSTIGDDILSRNVSHSLCLMIFIFCKFSHVCFELDVVRVMNPVPLD